MAINGNRHIHVRPAFAALIAVLLLVPGFSGCVSTSVQRVNAIPAKHAEREIPDAQLLNVNIAVFDPGLPKPPEASADPNVFPEVRKAEARYLPVNLRDTLQDTGYWGAVRVVPEPIPYSELLVTGKILHSDGLVLELKVHAEDASGRVWLDKVYNAEAAKLSYQGKQAQKDPFQGLYNRIADDLLKVRQNLKTTDLTTIRHLSEMRFAGSLAPDAFDRYVAKDGKRYRLKGLPAAGDPDLARVDNIRRRDYDLIDALDRHYRIFHQQVKPAYADWRASSYTEAEQVRTLHRQSLTRKVLGAAALLAGIFGAVKSRTPVEGLGSEAAIFGGAILIGSGIGKGSEAKIHAAALKELGQSLESDVKPRVVKLKNQTVTLSGSAEEQYDQWRRLLKKIYAQETGFGDDASGGQKAAPAH